MKYTKPALTTEQQADLILERGLQADRVLLIERLSSVSYYRLSAYWHTFRQDSTETLRPGSTLDIIWDRYVFDRQLRVLVMDAIERKALAIPRPRKHPEWHAPVLVTGDRMFGVLTVLRYLLKYVAPQSNWSDRFSTLIAHHPDIPIHFMGFPQNWTECPIWAVNTARVGSDHARSENGKRRVGCGAEKREEA